jgi:organic hydroperoxide reductase OsmC/OhrA
LAKIHEYTLEMRWTGNKGSGTFDYRSYERNHEVEGKGKPIILMSSDPSFRGDKTRYNPEETFLASVSSCHMLWYLHLCSDAGVIVISYIDNPIGIMEEFGDGRGKFTKIILRPQVRVTQEWMMKKALELHHKANEYCFVANSLNFEVEHKCEIALE